MRQTIVETLERIQREQNIYILYAVESGSRAWGFASPDSDYDVRYIYVRRREDYLRIDQPKDTIDGPLDDVLDFSGWDIRKTLSLLKKTNPSLMEWVRSPIVYHTTPAWKRLTEHFPAFFSVRKNMYHYLSMAASNWDKMLAAEEVRLKHYLYTLRALLSCRWLAEFGSSPSIEFAVLRERVLPEYLQDTVEELLRRKVAADEKGMTSHFPELDDFISRELIRLRDMLPGMPDVEIQDYTALNALLLQVLEDVEKTW